jgi:hypothetical protein
MHRTLLALSASVLAIGALILAGCSKDNSPTGPGGNTTLHFITTKTNLEDSIAVGKRYARLITAQGKTGDSLIFSVKTGLTLTAQDSIIWTPDTADTGANQFWVIVTDTAGKKDSIGWTIFVHMPGWENVGTTVSTGEARDGKIFVSNGTPYVVYKDYTNGDKETMMKFDGTAWVPVGTPGFTTGSVSNVVVAVAGTTPYVAFTINSDSLVILKFDGSNWVNVGPGFSSINSFSFLIDNGTPYIAYSNATGIQVMSFNGSTWVDAGGVLSGTFYGVSSLSFGICNGQQYVVYSDLLSSNVVLKQYSGTAWATVDSITFPGVVDNVVLCVSNGALFVGCEYINTTTFNTIVLMKKLVGSALVDVGAPGSIANGDDIEYPSFCVYNGVPYVAFDDETRDSDPNPRAAVVKQFNGTSWIQYAGYASQCDIEYTSLAVDATSGQLYLTYQDVCQGSKLVVVRH